VVTLLLLVFLRVTFLNQVRTNQIETILFLFVVRLCRDQNNWPTSYRQGSHTKKYSPSWYEWYLRPF